MPTWTIVPAGKGMMLLTKEHPSKEEEADIHRMIDQLIKITGIPWIFIGDADLVDEKTVKEIAERFYGIKR